MLPQGAHFFQDSTAGEDCYEDSYMAYEDCFRATHWSSLNCCQDHRGLQPGTNGTNIDELAQNTQIMATKLNKLQKTVDGMAVAFGYEIEEDA